MNEIRELFNLSNFLSWSNILLCLIIPRGIFIKILHYQQKLANENCICITNCDSRELNSEIILLLNLIYIYIYIYIRLTRDKIITRILYVHHIPSKMDVWAMFLLKYRREIVELYRDCCYKKKAYFYYINCHME